jgi:signal peptide peptidase SppA
MRFQQIIELTYGQPWLITSDGWQAVNAIVSAHVLNERVERPKADFFGDPLPVMTIDKGVATIPIHGTIVRRASMISKQCGAVDTLDIAQDFRKALNDSKVRAIVLDVSSPGGAVSGTAELASDISRARGGGKYIVAYTGDQMASAAYWISSAAHQVVAAPSAIVGSIGVLIPWIDQSEAYKQRGLRVDLITAGKFKGMGYPGTSLSDAQRKLLQDRINDTYAAFKSFVKEHREGAKDSSMEGQVFSGVEGKKVGLVTDLAESLEEVQAAFAR